MSLTTAMDVHTSLNIIMQRSITKLLSYSLIKLNANMQSTSARDRNTKLSKMVIDKMRMSKPSIWAATEDFRLIA